MNIQPSPGKLLRWGAAVAFALATVGPPVPAQAMAPDSNSRAATHNQQDPQHPYRHGIHWTRERAGSATSSSNLRYGGGIGGVGVTTGSPRVYLVFWGSQWGTQGVDANGNVTLSRDANATAPLLQRFFKGLGTGSETWSGVMTQYCQGVASGSTSCPSGSAQVGYPTGGALAGVWADTANSEPSQATGHDLGAEAVRAAAHFGNTTSASNRSVQYVVLSASGLHPDGFNTRYANWCAWHDYTGDSTLSGGAVASSYGDVAFTNMPYVDDMRSSCGQNFVNANGTNDGVTIVEGHEYAETITDQFPAGGWTDSGGAENGDKCAWISSGQGASQNITLTTGSFAVQSTWANDFNSGAGGCEVSHPVVGGTAPADDFSIAVSPQSQSVVQGQSVTYNVTTAATSGSGGTVTLSSGTLQAGETASFNPSSVAAGGSSVMTVSTTSTTPTGTSTLTVNGNNGTSSHSASTSLTVSAPATSDFSISASPSSQSVVAGSSTTYTVATAVTSGSATSVNLSAGGLPGGATASFNPASVSAGGSSTLTVSTASTTPAGTSTITVTGSAGSTAHSTTVSLVVSAPSSGNPVTNGGFETGSLAGWTASGASAGVSTTSHSGSYSAQLGSTGPTNGDSSISQTISVPAAGGTLSLYYQVHCPDTVTYDWATVSLKDNSSGTTATVLGKTCTNSGAWSSVSYGLSSNAGHSVTLTLTSHDDNYSGDATYTLFDDVAIAAAPPPPPPSALANGGFEAGNLSSWTQSGAAGSVTTSNPHSGQYSALLGSTSPTNGDSSISQTFTVPSGATSLSFYYRVTCPDTVTYDWATATLKDNTSGTTTTILAKTCTNNGTWVAVSSAITAWHSLTLTLTSHDDNYTGDATYTQYDDVSVS